MYSELSYKLINKFYKDYKKMVEIVNDKTNLTNSEILRFLNFKIIEKFSESEEMLSYKLFFDKAIKFYRIDYSKIDYKIIEAIDKIVNKYSWGINNKDSSLISPDILGNVFEKYINQKENGAYYTPLDTIEYINKGSLCLYLISNIEELNYTKSMGYFQNYDLFWDSVGKLEKAEIFKLIKQLSSIKVSDISVGTGAFIINMVDLLIETIERLHTIVDIEVDYNKIINNIFESSVFGIDIMQDAVDLAKFRMILKYIQLTNKYNLRLPKKLKINVFTSNTLLVDSKTLENKIGISKFDLIIGNPPYVEYSKVKNKYQLTNYETIKSGNIYAFMIEKSYELVTNNGVLGVIVPISLVSTTRMCNLRNYLFKRSENIYFASFADRPGSLFNGVHQKLTILFANKNLRAAGNMYTTSYMHWNENERNLLFKDLQYIKNDFKKESYIPKIGNQAEKDIFDKITSNSMSLADLTFNSGDYKLYLSMRMAFWVKTFFNKTSSSEYKELRFANEKDRDLYYLIVNSDIFFFFWEVVSDGWHITNKELHGIMLNYDSYCKINKKTVKELTTKLSKSIDLNKEYIGSKQTDYIYKHKKSKCIIDEINIFIGDLFDLDSTEIEYLRNYNLSVRMNDELLNYKNKRSEKDECN